MRRGYGLGSWLGQTLVCGGVAYDGEISWVCRLGERIKRELLEGTGWNTVVGVKKYGINI